MVDVVEWSADRWASLVCPCCLGPSFPRPLCGIYIGTGSYIYIYGLGEHCLCINIDVKRLVIGFHSLTHIASVFFFSGSPSAGKIGLAVLPVPIYVYTKTFV